MDRQTSWIVESQRLPVASYAVCAVPLTQHGTIVAVGRFGLCHLYSPRHRRWQALPPMREGRFDCCVVPLGDEIFVLGGFNGYGYSFSSVERLKLDDEGQPLGNWVGAPGMTQGRANCAAVVAEGKIVVVGGYDSNSDSSLSSAEMFDPLKNMWQRLPDMATKRDGFAAVAVGDKVFAFGGRDGSSYHNSAECLCINTKKWHSLPSMRKRRYWPAAVAMGGRILVVGGYDEERRKLSDVEVFDTSTIKWEKGHDIPSLNTGRNGHGATTVENRIYVVGGVDNNNNDLDTMEILEVQEAPHPPQPDLETEIARRDAEIAKLSAEIAKRDVEIAKLRTQIARANTTPNTKAPQPDHSEFKTRIDLEAEVAILKKQIQDGNNSFKANVITLAVQAEERLPRLEELLKTMPTAEKLRADISNLEEGIRGLSYRNRLKDAIPLARKHEELVEQLRKEEMAEGQKTQATLRGHGDSGD